MEERQKEKIKFILSMAALALVAFVIGGALMLPIMGDQINSLFSFSQPKPKIEKPKTEAQLQQQMSDIIQTKDTDKCSQIKNDAYKNACTNNIAMNLAKEKEDVSYCQKIDDKLMSRKNCIASVIMEKSIATENIAVCQETTDELLKKSCENDFWPNLAMKKGDIALCQNIQADQVQSQCHDNYLFSHDFINDKENFNCNVFQDAANKADCIIFKKNSQQSDSKMCSSFKGQIFPSLCPKIIL